MVELCPNPPHRGTVNQESIRLTRPGALAQPSKSCYDTDNYLHRIRGHHCRAFRAGRHYPQPNRLRLAATARGEWDGPAYPYGHSPGTEAHQHERPRPGDRQFVGFCEEREFRFAAEELFFRQRGWEAAEGWLRVLQAASLLWPAPAARFADRELPVPGAVLARRRGPVCRGDQTPTGSCGRLRWSSRTRWIRSATARPFT